MGCGSSKPITPRGGLLAVFDSPRPNSRNMGCGSSKPVRPIVKLHIPLDHANDPMAALGFELSSTALTDTGVLKLIATVDKGTPYGKVFKSLEYLALSSTPQELFSSAVAGRVASSLGVGSPKPWSTKLPPLAASPSRVCWSFSRVARIFSWTREHCSCRAW